MEDRAHIELSRRAERDLRRLGPSVARELMEALAPHPLPPNRDVAALRGHRPWLRLRLGGHRAIFRPLTAQELERLGIAAPAGYLVARVVDRRELERAVAALR